jgi:hypothetical protein
MCAWWPLRICAALPFPASGLMQASQLYYGCASTGANCQPFCGYIARCCWLCRHTVHTWAGPVRVTDVCAGSGMCVPQRFAQVHPSVRIVQKAVLSVSCAAGCGVMGERIVHSICRCCGWWCVRKAAGSVWSIERVGCRYIDMLRSLVIVLCCTAAFCQLSERGKVVDAKGAWYPLVGEELVRAGECLLGTGRAVDAGCTCDY